MAGTVGWVTILVLAVGLEAGARGGAPWPTLREVGSAIAARPVGRVLLAAAWLFVGLHLFARYTVPR